jgi:methionyl-tRNA formyltransferase
MSHRLIFAGTPEFARVSLSALVDAGMLPLAVLTQPDRPAGRGRRIAPGPVKRFADERGIPVWQPSTLINKGVRQELEALELDAIIVAAYGLLLPQDLLAVPRAGCINVHASLLPRWRGAAPIQAAILAGDRETGISLMQMDAGLDTGAVYVQEALEIRATETAGELHDRLADLGARLLLRHLTDILDGRLQPTPQREAEATRAGKIGKEEALLDWHLPAAMLARKVRAFDPVPGARFMLDDEQVKCWSARPLTDSTGTPGDVLSVPEGPQDGIVVACGEGALCLLELQRPGRGRVSAFEFERQVKLGGRRLGR